MSIGNDEFLLLRNLRDGVYSLVVSLLQLSNVFCIGFGIRWLKTHSGCAYVFSDDNLIKLDSEILFNGVAKVNWYIISNN